LLKRLQNTRSDYDAQNLLPRSFRAQSALRIFSAQIDNIQPYVSDPNPNANPSLYGPSTSHPMASDLDLDLDLDQDQDKDSALHSIPVLPKLRLPPFLRLPLAKSPVSPTKHTASVLGSCRGLQSQQNQSQHHNHYQNQYQNQHQSLRWKENANENENEAVDEENKIVLYKKGQEIDGEHYIIEISKSLAYG
jgi:hypothetical protein